MALRQQSYAALLGGLAQTLLLDDAPGKVCFAVGSEWGLFLAGPPLFPKC